MGVISTTPRPPALPDSTGEVVMEALRFMVDPVLSWLALLFPLWIWAFLWLKRKDDPSWKASIITMLIFTSVWLVAIFWIDQKDFLRFMFPFTGRVSLWSAYFRYILPGGASLLAAYWIFGHKSSTKQIG